MQVKNLSKIENLTHGFYNTEETKSITNPLLMTQVHSAHVLYTDTFVELPKTDGLITQKSHLNLTVKTADCAPILIAEPNAHLISAVHAGWKSAFQGILEAAVVQLQQRGAKPQHMLVGIGPCLHKENFRMGPEIHALFPITEHAFFTPTNDGGFLFDFIAYLKDRLHRMNIDNIDIIDIDTYTNSAYNSYRRDPKNPARQFSCIQWTD